MLRGGQPAQGAGQIDVEREPQRHAVGRIRQRVTAFDAGEGLLPHADPIVGVAAVGDEVTDQRRLTGGGLVVLIALLAVEAVEVVIAVALVAAGLVHRPAQPTPKRARRPFSRTS